MDDETFLRQVESATWPLRHWRHREHVKVAYLYLCRYPFSVALDRMRRTIVAYNAAHQVPDNPTSGFHETITEGWMRLVYLTLCEYGPGDSAEAFLNKHTQLLSTRALLIFYSRDRIMSAEAKRRFIEPDLTRLPRSAREFDLLQAREGSRPNGVDGQRP